MGLKDMESDERKYVPLMPIDELQPGERTFFEAGDRSIVVFRVGNEFYAIEDECTHDHGPLGDGEVIGYEVVCPRHGARFDIRNGKATRLPAVEPTGWYSLRIHEGMVEITFE